MRTETASVTTTTTVIDPLDAETVTAELIGVAPSTLRRWRIEGRGPRWHRIGRKAIRYRRSETLAWLNAQEQGGEAIA